MTAYVARNANGCSSSPWFSARCRQTLPTTCHDGCRRRNHSATGPRWRTISSEKARPMSRQRAAIHSPSTYSAPGIGGTPAANRTHSSSGRSTSTRSRSSSSSGTARSRVTNARPTSLRNPSPAVSAVSTSVVPRSSNPCPTPRSNAAATRARAAADRPVSSSAPSTSTSNAPEGKTVTGGRSPATATTLTRGDVGGSRRSPRDPAGPRRARPLAWSAPAYPDP